MGKQLDCEMLLNFLLNPTLNSALPHLTITCYERIASDICFPHQQHSSSSFFSPTLAGDDVEEARDLLHFLGKKISSSADEAVNFSPIPLNAGDTLVMTFDTANGDNDVILKVTVGITGGGAATLA